MMPPVFISERPHTFKVQSCKLIVLSKQANETAAFGGVIDAAAPKWTGVESLAQPEQTGSPQRSLTGMQLPLLDPKHFTLIPVHPFT